MAALFAGRRVRQTSTELERLLAEVSPDHLVEGFVSTAPKADEDLERLILR